MKEEENLKQLLLQDLCARLPYGVMIHIDETNESEELYCLNIPQEGLYTRNKEHHNISSLCPIEQVKPYLRSMSSMTEEERQINYHYIKDIMYEGAGSVIIYINRYINWLNSKHFDWRVDDNNKTLIEKGLALEAPKNMYKFD